MKLNDDSGENLESRVMGNTTATERPADGCGPFAPDCRIGEIQSEGKGNRYPS